MALTDIGRSEMAQASGLINVVRQVGGSFGVAILQTLLTFRLAFHTATVGASIDSASPVFVRTLGGLQIRAMHDLGQTAQQAFSQAGAVISSHFSQQVFVMGIDDDFMFSCFCTLACIVPILILKNRKKGLPDELPSRKAS